MEAIILLAVVIGIIIFVKKGVKKTKTISTKGYRDC